MVTLHEINCPGCGARVSISTKECEWCHQPVIITTFNSVEEMNPLQLNKYAAAYRKALAEDPTNTGLNNSIAMCYLKLKLYDQAIPAFIKAMEDNFDNSETYFYAAIATLRGKKAFLTLRPEIDKILSYLEAACMIEPKGIYYYFMAYIKYDYFARKCFKTTPDYKEILATANQFGVSQTDVITLFGLLGVERPTVPGF